MATTSDSPKVTSSDSVNSCVLSPAYSANVGSYAVLSPVLVPYVQAPVFYANSKSKHTTKHNSSSSSGKVRYVPAYTYTTVYSPYICYNQNCLSPATKDGTQNLSQRLGIPFAMRINPEARSLNHGYVSALTPPSAYMATELDVPLTVRSGLNPLSRPYTPPSRRKVCTCACKKDGSDVTSLSSFSGGDCDGSSSDSRVSTPVCRCPLEFSDKAQTGLSDTDSGVEGECDDVDNEDDWFCDSKKSDNDSSSDVCLDSADDLILKTESLDNEKVPGRLIVMVDFLCRHLDSHEWRAVAREMNVDDLVIQIVEYDFYDSFRDQMRSVFTFWAKSQKLVPSEDCFAMVEKALTEIGRSDLIKLLQTKLEHQSDSD